MCRWKPLPGARPRAITISGSSWCTPGTWRYAVRRRLAGEKRGSFALHGSNWFIRPESGPATEAAWRADIALLGNEHRLLREAVAAFPARTLRERRGRSAVSPFDLIAGIAAHDLYHAGQIQLLKKQGVGRIRPAV